MVVNVIINNTKAVILLSINDCITIHFGRNPSIGGSPPRDKSDVIIMNLISVLKYLAE